MNVASGVEEEGLLDILTAISQLLCYVRFRRDHSTPSLFSHQSESFLVYQATLCNASCTAEMYSFLLSTFLPAIFLLALS